MDVKKPFLKTRRGLVILGFIVVSVIGVPLTVFFLQQQQIFQQQANCILNDVIFCGAKTKAEIINAMKNGDSKGRKDIAAIFSYYGITEAGINSSDTKEGRIYRDGRVTIGTDQVVARNVTTAGRDKKPGSTPCGPLFCRPPSIVFFPGPDGDYGIALVHVENGVFKWAILTGCGNPAIGPPLVTPTPTPAITLTPTPTPTEGPTSTPTPTDEPTGTPTPTSKVTPTNGPTATPTTPAQNTSTPVPPTGTIAVYPTIVPSGPGDMFIGLGMVGVVLTVIGGLIFILL